MPPHALFDQTSFAIKDHDHFRRLLDRCEPAERANMYAALASRLKFQPKPLDVYTAELAGVAEAKQLPTIAKDGTLLPFKRRELQTPEYRAQQVIARELAKYHLKLTCRKCTRYEMFDGERKIDAIKAARSCGWTYQELNNTGYEICPTCPGGGVEQFQKGRTQ